MDTRWVFSPGRLGNGEACHQMQRRAALLPAPSRTESPCPRWRGNKESLVTSLLPDQQHACPDFPLLQLFSPPMLSPPGTTLSRGCHLQENPVAWPPPWGLEYQFMV